MAWDVRGRARGIGVGALLLAAAVGLAGGRAAADEVKAKGTVLQGKVTGLGSGGVTFEPEYGKGALTIDWKDVEDIKTDGSFQTFHDDDESVGPLQGMSDGQLLVGQSREAATRIDVKTIYLGVPIGPNGLSFQDRLRSAGRYWDGNFDVGFNLQDATTDTKGFLVALQTARTKDRTIFTLGASYRYANQTTKKRVPDPIPGDPMHTRTDTDRNIIEDQALGLIRGDYKFTPRFYGFASGDATYDSIQDLSIRAVPEVGLGYILFERPLGGTDRDFLQVEAGGGWVYEKFFGGDDDDFFTIIFGARAGYHLPYGAVFGWKFDFLPAVDDFTGDYLLRTEAGLGIPIVGPVSAKFMLRDEYDSTPARDTDKNSLYLTIGASIAW